jgi:adenine deaminase
MRAQRVKELILVAQGQKKAEVVIENVHLVNVYSREIQPSFSIGLSKDRVAYVGPSAFHLIGPKTQVIDGGEGYLLPGFIDAHTHLDNIFTCAAYAPFALATGNTTAVTEMAMIGNALGKPGIEWFMAEAGAVPLRVLFLAPALTPPFPELETSRGLGRKEFAQLLKDKRVLGIGEAYWPRVVGRDPRVIEGYAQALRLNKTREGHAAGARGGNLTAYVAAGTTSCHEATSLEEALERLRLGLAVMIREGLVRKELEAIAPIAGKGVDLHRLMLVSDLFDPGELVQGRGMNALLARAVELGFDPVTAVQMVTRNVADYYHLRDLGGLAPGKLADLVLVEDLRSFACRRVWVEGRLVVDQGRVLHSPNSWDYPPAARRSLTLPRIDPGILILRAPRPETTVRVVKVAGPTITRETAARMVSQNGCLESNLEEDLLKTAVFHRFDSAPRPALGFTQGLGLKKGAVATSFTWDAGNLLVIGVSDREMALAANRLLDLGGGLVVSAGDQILAEMPLPIMGLISEQPLPELNEQIKALEQAFLTLGSGLERPFLTLQTFCFTGLPFIRLTDKGLADVRERKLVNLFLEK